MTKAIFSFLRLTAIFFAILVFFSCNNAGDVPFPKEDLGYTQPVIAPLIFSNEKKLNWDTANKGGISPVIKNLDIDALPAIPYDSGGFRPFPQPPEQVNFDFTKLPGATLHLDKTSSSLGLKFSLLPPATITKALPAGLQKGKALSIFDLGQAQGLQAKFIGALYKDKSGLLWIGGREGLFRYDGEHVQTFIQGNTSLFPISGIIEDNEGNIWFTQAGLGISVINLHNGTIGYSDRITFAPNDITRLSKDANGNIWAYDIKDKALSIINPVTYTYKNLDAHSGLSDSQAFLAFQDDNKNTWIATFQNGLNIIDTAGRIKYLGQSNGLSSDSIETIAMDKKGQIWIALADGLNAIDLKKGTITYYNKQQGLKKAFTFKLSFDSSGNLWRATSEGIDVVNIQNSEIRHIDDGDGLSGNTALATAIDNYHRMWIGTTTGISMIDQNGKTVHPLGTTQIISLMEDTVKNLWVATRKGIYIVNAQRTAMRLLDKSRGLSDDFVQSYWKRNGNIVIATDGGFNIIDPVHKTLLKAGKKEGLVSDTIYVAYSDNSGNMWLTGPSNGVDMVDFGKNIILHTDVSEGLSDNNIQDVKQDREGLLWLATNKGGINVIDPVKGTVRYLNNQPGLKDTCNRMMLADKYGRMWIGTDKGIYIADTKNNTLTNISIKQGLSNNTILSLLEYNGNILAGTNNKVNMIAATAPGDTTNNWKISLLDKSQGLLKETNSWSTDCITTSGQYLWGDLGLSVIHNIKPVSDSVATYVTGINIMTQPQYFININNPERQDTIWTSDTFYIGKMPKDAIPIDEKKYTWDKVSGPYNLPQNLSIPHDKNYMQFQFAQANLSRQDTTFYTYILEGIDKNWSIPTTNTTTESYLNLPPGKYTFKVSSKDINGTWNAPATFNFTINPPWYQTWWAYAIFVFSGLVLLRFYIIYRSRKLQKENKTLEEKVEHRTKQLKQSLDHLKATQSQLIQSEKMASLGELTAGIAHEIQNPLNFVNNFSEVNIELTDELKEELNKVNLSPSEKSTLEQIAGNIRSNQEKINFHGKRADNIVKGMLQHSRSSNGEKELININQLADEYFRLAYHGLRAKDKSFNATMKTDFDESIGKINVVPQDIGRVILNLITNGFYSVTEKKKTLCGEGAASFEPQVEVSTKKIGDKIAIKVSDNGNGVPKKVLDKIFQPFFTTKPSGAGTGLGLSLSYDIIKAHNGELKVETKEGEGAEFTIILPG